MIAHILKIEANLKEFLSRKEKSILFVHNKKSAERLAPFKKILNKRHCIIIPTSVEALFILDELKLPYRIPEDYYRPEEIYNYTYSLNPKIINLVERIDQELEKVYSEIKRSGLMLAFYHLYPFVRVFHPLADIYFKINKIIQKEKPDKIGLLIEQNERSSMSRGLEGWLLWGDRENLFQRVLNAYQINLPVHFFVLNKTNQSVKSDFFKENWRDRIGKRLFQGKPRLYYFLKTLKKDWKFALILLCRQFKLTPLFLLNGGYNWDLCDRELYKRGYYIRGQLNDNLENWYQGEKIDPRLSKNILQQLDRSPSFRKNFKEKNIDFYPLLRNKISLFLEKVVPASLYAFQKTSQLIKKKQLRGVLFSTNSTAISKSITYVAQKNNIPVIGWQHGDMNTKQLFAIVLNDLLTCDLFLSWGRGADKNRMEIANKLELKRKTKVVGSSTLDGLISLTAQDRFKVLKKTGIKNITRPIIVYATTMYYLSNTYNFSYPPWSDNYIYDAQKKIIERLALFKGTKIIKLHPNLFYTLSALDEYCRSFKRQNVWTIRNELLSTLLFSIADVIIVDLPSTTLLQAIACKKPIFCLTRHLKLEDKAIEILRKRVVLAEDPELLMKEVESFFQSGQYKADLQNSEFLENFGTMPDCRAAERAAAVVDILVKDFSSQ